MNLLKESTTSNMYLCPLAEGVSGPRISMCNRIQVSSTGMLTRGDLKDWYFSWHADKHHMIAHSLPYFGTFSARSILVGWLCKFFQFQDEHHLQYYHGKSVGHLPVSI